VLEDSEVYVKASLEQGAPFEAGPRSLTLDERKPGCADVFQPSGVPKVAVLVGVMSARSRSEKASAGGSALAREPRIMTARRSCWIFAQMRKRSIMRPYVRGDWFTFYPSLL
jgi:hypothetical protein